MTRLALAVALVALVGCRSGGTNPRPPLPGVTPEETLTNFRRDLWHGDYKAAYEEMTSETKQRYTFSKWSTFMSRTKVGALLEMVFIDYYLYSVRFSPDQQWAYAVFADPHKEDASKEFRMKQEEGKWKLWFSFAELFGMPFEDELEVTGKKDTENKEPK